MQMHPYGPVQPLHLTPCVRPFPCFRPTTVPSISRSHPYSCTPPTHRRSCSRFLPFPPSGLLALSSDLSHCCCSCTKPRYYPSPHAQYYPAPYPLADPLAAAWRGVGGAPLPFPLSSDGRSARASLPSALPPAPSSAFAAPRYVLCGDGGVRADAHSSDALDVHVAKVSVY